MNRFFEKYGIVMACFMFSLSFVMTGVTFLTWPHTKTQATTAEDTTSYVSVGEIHNHYNSNSAAEVQKLYDLLAGHEQTTLQDLTTLAYDAERNTLGKGYNATAIREQNFGKDAGQDIQVTFGGLKWQVCYLSQDINNQPILTLVLANSIDRDEKYTCWNVYRQVNAEAKNYPSNLYGRSYIRAVTLNNGGKYAVNLDSLSDEITKDADNYFATFTMDEVLGSVTDVLALPKNIPWQIAGQNALQNANLYLKLPNENLTETTENWAENRNYSSNGNSKDGYDLWGNDYLWLPSTSEMDPAGIWGLSDNQRAADERCWFRSGGNLSDCAYYMAPSGFISFDAVSAYYTVRPAVHLQLNAASIAAHTHEYYNWTTVTAATCVNAGEETGSCAICGTIATRVIPATGIHEYDDWQVVNEPTCVAEGCREKVCQICEHTLYEDIAMVDHEYMEWDVVKKPDCVNAGIKQRLCQKCNHADVVDISPNGIHQFDDWQEIVVPTINEVGVAQHTCIICGTSELQEIPVLETNNNFPIVPVVTGSVAGAAAIAGIICVAVVANKRRQ